MGVLRDTGSLRLPTVHGKRCGQKSSAAERPAFLAALTAVVVEALTVDGELASLRVLVNSEKFSCILACTASADLFSFHCY